MAASLQALISPPMGCAPKPLPTLVPTPNRFPLDGLATRPSLTPSALAALPRTYGLAHRTPRLANLERRGRSPRAKAGSLRDAAIGHDMMLEAPEDTGGSS